MGSEYAHVIANLAFVLALMLILIYALKKMRVGKFTGNKDIKIINIVPIGAKERILLLEVNSTTLLVGSTPNHIETLYVFGTEQKTEPEQMVCIDPVKETKSFSAHMLGIKKLFGNKA